MKPSIVGAAIFGFLAIAIVTAQPTVTLNVDVSAQRKPISPFIYGLNYAKEAFAHEIGLPLRRWGGNHTTRYNWPTNAMNHGSDWFFHNNTSFDPFTGANESADQWVARNTHTATQSLMTVPMIGVVAKDADPDTCGFNRARHPVQDHFDTASGFPDCGDGFNGGVPLVSDPLDTSTAITEAFATGWVNHLTATHGTAAGGGVRFYALDNEPGLWHETHRDAHAAPFSYDESFNRGSSYAAAIKAADPGALVLGPVQDGWARYWYASFASQAQAEQDRLNHGGTFFVPWYLQQMRAFQQANGVRLLDYLDLHFYPQNGVALSTAGNASKQALRLRSVRALWDPTYVDESWIGGAGLGGGIVRLIPRMHDWVDPPGDPASGFPGTKLAITEYNFGGLEHINGALAQADVLGIFGREGLDLATLWNYPQHLNGAGEEIEYEIFETLPGAYAFRMYRNYDGAGSRFGDTSVSATSSDQGRLSIYAAERTGDGSLTLIIINKAAAVTTGTVNIAGFATASSAQVWRYSAANLDAIVPQANHALDNNGFSASFPASSITLVRIAARTALISLTGSLAFGNVPVNTTATRTLTIHNTGNATLTVSSIAYPAGFTGNFANGTIPAGGSQPVDVTFAPAAAMAFGGTLTVNADQTAGITTTTASGTGTSTAATRIMSLAGNLAFGHVPVGATATSTLTIANSGTAVLTVNAVTYPAGFSGNWPGGPIAPGGSQPVAVTFAPAIASSYAGTLVVEADHTSGTSSIAVSGRTRTLLWRHRVTGQDIAWLLAGSTIATAAFAPTVADVNWEIKGMGDFDGDATRDAIWRHKVSGQHIAWLMRGTTVVLSAFLPTIADTNWEIKSVGDFDGDSRGDVILRNSATGQNIAWLMNGAAVSSSMFLPTIADTNWEIAGVGDFDGNRRADVIWRNKATGQNIAWLMNGLTVSVAAFLPTIADTNWEIKGVGDLDANGSADVVWRNRVTGQNIGWLMNGTTVASAAFLTTIADTNWDIKSVRDLNGDDKSDLVWRNRVSGQNIAWLMNGFTINAAAFLPTIADTNWEIAGQ